MDRNDAKDVARRWFEIGNAKDPSALDDILAPDFVNHTPPPGMPGNREGYRQFYACIVRGTHTGDLMGVPPSGNEVSMRAITIDQVQGDKIVAQGELADNLTMMQQIGALPTVGQGG
jgi:hypothetical protein